MNMHLANSLQSMVELKLLASVSTQIVSPQASKPVIGLVQDGLLGPYLLSLGTKLSMKHMMRLLGWLSVQTNKLPEAKYTSSVGPEWSGHQLLSMFLPKIAYKNGNVRINDGQMDSGILNKKITGATRGSVFHITWNDYGPKTTRDFLDNINNLAMNWLLLEGFSVGYNDCVTTSDMKSIIEEIVDEGAINAENYVEQAKLGLVADVPSEFDKKMIEKLNITRGNVENLLIKLDDGTNRIGLMISAGSKGAPNNLIQIKGLLGQQEVEGHRITDYYYRRPLPHYNKDNLSPEARGFIRGSFGSGLNPSEYWFHAQAGRVGVISKAISTADTGYIQRKLIKTMEDLKIAYDGTVRNANGMIIQTVYGNDGFDPCFVENQRIRFISDSYSKLGVKYGYLGTDDLSVLLIPSAYSRHMKEDKRKIKDLMAEEFASIHENQLYLRKIYVDSLPEKVQCAVNFERIIRTVVNKFHLNNLHMADITPVEIIESVNKLRKRLKVSDDIENNIIFESLFSTNLSSKQLILKKFNKIAFEYLLNLIETQYYRSRINPGEMIGPIAAQSIGEPCTQLVLDAFHHTGIGSKAKVTQGVPRLKELLGISSNMKTPSMTVYIDDDYIDKTIESKENWILCKKLRANIEYTKLLDLVKQVEMFYDEFGDMKSCVSEDQEFVDNYYEMLLEGDEEFDFADSPWLIRFEFDHKMILERDVSMNLLQYKISTYLDNMGIGYTVIMSDDNSHKLISRVKLLGISDDDPLQYLQNVEKNLMEIPIKGIEGISKCHNRELKMDIKLPDGTTISPYDDKWEALSKKYNGLQYVYDTDGANMLEVLNLPDIDTYNTVSNNVVEMYNIYGVEVARRCLIEQIDFVLESGGTSINRRHLELLVDVMVNQGILISVDRYGLNKSEGGPLARASFEETAKQITNASLFSDVDNMMGVSGNILFGQLIKGGTNSFKIGLDINMLSTVPIPDQPDLYRPEKIKVIDVKDISNICLMENFKFRFELNKLF